MNGVNIREVQDLSGHKHVETTMIYIHVMRDMTRGPTSPLDLLDSRYERFAGELLDVRVVFDAEVMHLALEAAGFGFA
jgi:hypothetical protein